MLPSNASRTNGATQIVRDVFVFAAIAVFAGFGEARAQSPILPHYSGVVLPSDRGPLSPSGPAAPTDRPGRPGQTCPQGDCGLMGRQPASISLPGARLAAMPTVTASPASCDPGLAAAGAAPGAYSPRYAEVALTRRFGTYLVKGIVNDCLTFEFYLDSGAADVTMSRAQFERLRASHAVLPAEIAGQDTYVMADGRTATQEIFLIRKLQLGPMTVRNVRAAVMPGDSPSLLGMSFLSRFYTWSINNHREVLTLNFGTLSAPFRGADPNCLNSPIASTGPHQAVPAQETNGRAFGGSDGQRSASQVRSDGCAGGR